ncbi:unnamed protein product [Brassica rapa subsp. narinosa]|uniref:(rape) hypothetical protein n=1 Tax=Brassica napus TaxID=3708 RepID=A0A816YFB3_BRANA|nr:unnamed protein product [Brassica napus]
MSTELRHIYGTGCKALCLDAAGRVSGRTGLGRGVKFVTLTGLSLARHVALPDHGVGLDGRFGGVTPDLFVGDDYGAVLSPSNRPSLLNGRNGGVLVLELSSEVLSANSDVFAGLIAEKSPGLTCRMEISDVENLGVFKETVELMFEEEILARFNSNETENTQENLSKQLVWSITSCSDTNPRNQLKSLVNGILCKSSVYEKEQPEINKEDIYKAGKYCVDSLVKLFEEGSSSKS